MNYSCYSFELPETEQEVLLAHLSLLPFESFEETETGLNAYLPQTEDNEELTTAIVAVQQHVSFSFYKKNIPAQNWNALWESNFEPIRVNDFCGVRADFHPPFTDVRHEIVINPRMAFGTGHHPTTWMVMDLMAGLAFPGRKVLDYGCGTGILAILADMLGATMIDAVDIEEQAYQNTIENAQINDASKVQAYHGTLSAILDQGYDIILANINRNVILQTLPALHKKMRDGGHLLVSGILQADKELVVAAAADQGFELGEERSRGEWIALAFTA